MEELNDRLKELRDRVYNWETTQTDYIGQRLYGALEGLVSLNMQTPWMEVRARILAGAITHAKPIIQIKELIVGYNYHGDDDSIRKELALTSYTGHSRKIFTTHLEKGCLDEDQIEFILDVLEDINYLVKPVYLALERPPEIVKAQMEQTFQAWATPDTHTVIGYEKVLKMGFQGILDNIESEISNLEWKNPNTVHRKLILECAKQVVTAACNFGKRYKAVAEKLLKDTTDPEDISDLKRIISVVEHVPQFPARNLHEAIQSLWFAHIFNTWEDGINANSIGRIDQILYPYYKKDIEEGTITPKEAFELIACLWLKLYRDYDVQQSVIGGLTPEGVDGTNDLTYMMLDVTQQLGFIRCLSVRLHKKSPPKLIRRAMEVVKLGMGVPFFFNDDVIIPALMWNGIEEQDARDYAAIGCVELTIPGKANPHAVSNRVNLLKCLEFALNEGKSIFSNVQIGKQTGPVEKCKNIDDFIELYKQQVEYVTDRACFESNRAELSNSHNLPMIYKSILTEGCLESGKDFNSGGAKYSYHETMLFGIPNVADSLHALQKLVFEEKKYTLPQVVEILKSDFANEVDHQVFLNRADKYGNDSDEVDKFATLVFDHACTYLKTQKAIFGGGFFAQPFTYLWLVETGKQTSATPDGRRKGENLAYSLSPMQGRDVNGLTAMINSLAKFPYDKAAGGASAIVEVDPELFEDKNIDVICSLMQTAIEKGVGQLQFNVVTAEILKEAQLNPELHANLQVRVSGFSQKFCLLDKTLQDHIIARTKHKKL
jgi:trans-4-hydroxy-L-proline dehydratase